MLARSIFAVVLLSVVFPSTASAADMVCGRDFHLRGEVVSLDRPLTRMPPGITAAAQGTGITLVAGPGLAANAPALAAWQDAVDIWESWLEDNVSITIEGDLQPLGAGILGGTDFRLFSDTYDIVRNAMVSDAASNETLLASLPTSAQLSLVLSPLFLYSGDMIAAKANLRALGFDMSFDDPFADATITFNSDVENLFDYDPSDGIDSTMFDFEAIVVHEIGHALGFYSLVDIVDLLAASGLPGGAFVTPLDAFRMRPGDGAADFTLNPRVIADGTTETVQVSFDGTGDLSMSTGQQLGDGYQASHWKADEISSVFLGIMDPTLAPGVREELQPNDRRLFGLIGWDIAEDCDGDGIPNPCGATSVPDPTGAILALAAGPNPASGRVDLRFSLAAAGPVRLEILDVRGRRVVTPLDGEVGEGGHEVTWNGVDDRGRRVAAGVYYVRLAAAGGYRTVKLVKLD